MYSDDYPPLLPCPYSDDYGWIWPSEYQSWPRYSHGVMVACAVFNGLAFLLCFYTIVAMVWRKETRKNSFNLYIVFLMLPDALYNLQMCILGIGRSPPCTFKEKFLDYESISPFYGFLCCNLLMNCILAYELHSFLDQSHRGIRAGAPPLKRALVQVAVVYALAILLVVVLLFNTFLYEYIWVANMFVRDAIIAGMCFTALVFVIAVRIRIWIKGLIPRQGRTRVVTLFFQRIILVFLVFYIPALVNYISLDGYLMPPAFGWYHNFWAHQLFYVLAALQALVTLYVVLQKPDIAKAFFCGRDGFSERAGMKPRWSVVRTKGRQWCCRWFKNGNTNHRTTAQTGFPASSEWAMDDIYDDHPSSADEHMEDGNTVEDDAEANPQSSPADGNVEDADAVEDDVEANPQSISADGNVEDGDSGEYDVEANPQSSPADGNVEDGDSGEYDTEANPQSISADENVEDVDAAVDDDKANPQRVSVNEKVKDGDAAV